jgi:hypothetical protein
MNNENHEARGWKLGIMMLLDLKLLHELQGCVGLRRGERDRDGRASEVGWRAVEFSFVQMCSLNFQVECILLDGERVGWIKRHTQTFGLLSKQTKAGTVPVIILSRW